MPTVLKLYQPAELCQAVKRGESLNSRVIVVFRIQPVAEGDSYEYRPGYPVEKVKATIRMQFDVKPTGRIEKISGIITGISDGVVQMEQCYVTE